MDVACDGKAPLRCEEVIVLQLTIALVYLPSEYFYVKNLQHTLTTHMLSPPTIIMIVLCCGHWTVMQARYEGY